MPDLSRRILYQHDDMARVRIERDIVYKTGSHETPLTMDIYTPPDVTVPARLSVVFFVHGGPVPRDMPAPTTWGIFQSYAELLAAEGHLAVVFNHGLYDVTDYAQSQQDIAHAVEFVRTRAEHFQADPARIALWFFSGAGPQLSWVLRESPSYIRCAAAFYAMLDVRHMLPPHADEAAVAATKALSPTTYLRSTSPKLPLFIARAGQDSQMVNIGLDAFIHAAVAANAHLEVMNHPTGVHAFEALTDDPRTRDIIKAAITFMHRNLKG
jgi:acetyl esterase/lipase